jgi:hypothetical protein
VWERFPRRSYPSHFWKQMITLFPQKQDVRKTERDREIIINGAM